MKQLNYKLTMTLYGQIEVEETIDTDGLEDLIIKEYESNDFSGIYNYDIELPNIKESYKCYDIVYNNSVVGPTEIEVHIELLEDKLDWREDAILFGIKNATGKMPIDYKFTKIK